MVPSVTVVVVLEDRVPADPAGLVAAARAKWHPSDVQVILASSARVAQAVGWVPGAGQVSVTNGAADPGTLRRLAAAEATGDVLDFVTVETLLGSSSPPSPAS